MSVHLLDVNILIPLIDTAHTNAAAIHRWFEAHQADGWATCPMTENGLLRIVSSPSYPGKSTPAADLALLLEELCATGSHHFWPDDISLRHVLTSNSEVISSQLADLYLLALAVEHGGKFATIDRKIPAKLIPGGIDALALIHR